MSGGRLLFLSFLFGALPTFGATFICEPVSTSATEKLRLQIIFPVPFEDYFEPTLDEDEQKGGIVERFPVMAFPGNEFGVGTYLARGHDSFDSGVLTVFDAVAVRPKKEMRFPATYLKVTTSYPADWTGAYPKNSGVKLYELECRLAAREAQEKKQ